MAIRISDVALSKNTVSPKETVLVSVTIKHYGYFEQFTNQQLETYTYGELTDIGVLPEQKA